MLPTTQAAALTPAQARAATSSFLPSVIKAGYSINWNLGIQHVFAKDYTLDVRYVGTRGVHLLYQLQINRPAVVMPTHFLPTYLAAPSQATLDSLPLTLAQLTTERNAPGIGNNLAQFGFTSNITAYVPRGNSEYHGLAVELTKRFTAHNLFKASYTWSHLLDDSTAEVNSTTLSPRRPQDFNNIRDEWASSALDRRQRFSFTWLYEAPWFQKDNSWIKRNIIGNYQIAGTYAVASPAAGTPPRAVVQPEWRRRDRPRHRRRSSLRERAAMSPCSRTRRGDGGRLARAQRAVHFSAQVGAFPNSGRNIMATRGISNWDMTISNPRLQ